MSIVIIYYVKHTQPGLGLLRYCHFQLDSLMHKETTLVTATVTNTEHLS